MWATEGNLTVPKTSALTSELQIKEEQRSYIFNTTVAVSGKVAISIYDRTDNSYFVMPVSGDSKQIILANKLGKKLQMKAMQYSSKWRENATFVLK